MNWGLVLGIVGVVSLVASFGARWEKLADSDWESIGVFVAGLAGLLLGVFLIVNFFNAYGEVSAAGAALNLLGGTFLALGGLGLIIFSVN